MQKTVAALLITLAVSVMGIPLAYFMGQRSADSVVEHRLNEERDRARSQQQALIADLRDNLIPRRADRPAEADAPAAKPITTPSEAAPPEKLAAVDIKPTPAPEAPKPVDPSPTPALEKPLEPPALPIARESFEAVALGETYPAVARKFGREGSPALTMEDEHGSITRQYTWEWARPDGGPARITIRFVDGSLTEKDFRD